MKKICLQGIFYAHDNYLERFQEILSEGDSLDFVYSSTSSGKIVLNDNSISLHGYMQIYNGKEYPVFGKKMGEGEYQLFLNGDKNIFAISYCKGFDDKLNIIVEEINDDVLNDLDLYSNYTCSVGEVEFEENEISQEESDYITDKYYELTKGKKDGLEKIDKLLKDDYFLLNLYGEYKSNVENSNQSYDMADEFIPVHEILKSVMNYIDNNFSYRDKDKLDEKFLKDIIEEAIAFTDIAMSEKVFELLREAIYFSISESLKKPTFPSMELFKICAEGNVLCDFIKESETDFFCYACLDFSYSMSERKEERIIKAKKILKDFKHAIKDRENGESFLYSEYNKEFSDKGVVAIFDFFECYKQLLKIYNISPEELNKDLMSNFDNFYKDEFENEG